MELVDTHCHLQFDKYGSDQGAVYDRAVAAGVTRMLAVGTTLDDSRRAIELAQSKSKLWAAAGTHPHEAEALLENSKAAEEMVELLKQPKVVAIGEIGLDYYKNYTPRETQLKALRLQIEAGLPSGLPFTFHVRDAWSDFWQVFDEYEGLRGVVHSFSSGTKQLNAALERGLYIGLNGIMTFTRDQAQLEAAKQVPKERLVLETDAPFLTPAPKRDELCEPRHIKAVAEFLAELRGELLEDLAEYTTQNALKLFNLS
jgi:TatD DNase family protein